METKNANCCLAQVEQMVHVKIQSRNDYHFETNCHGNNNFQFVFNHKESCNLNDNFANKVKWALRGTVYLIIIKLYSYVKWGLNEKILFYSNVH